MDSIDKLKKRLLETGFIIDNEYLDRYCCLVHLNKDTIKELYKTQIHHIIPKCFYRIRNIKCDDTQDNLVNLSYKDHVLAHYYLSMCSNNSEFRYLNLCALKYCLNHRDYKKQDYYKSERELIEHLDKFQELYEESKKISSIKSSNAQKGKPRKNKGTKHIHKDGVYKMVSPEELQHYVDEGWEMGGRPLSENHRKSLLTANLGKKKSQECRDKLSKLSMGRVQSEHVRKVISESSRDRVWISDGKKNYFIKREVLNSYLESGFAIGRVNFNSEKIRLNDLKLGKKVLCVETGVIYNSEADALRATGIQSIGKCCRGRRKTAGGYHWKFLQEK